jgi:L-ascorbate metabolism protein UlaG (beta-lactamase superfamily)
MIRMLTTLFAVLLVTTAAPAADAKKLTLRWHGQSFFELETSAGNRIVFDPHEIEAYTKVVGRINVTADLVCISHMHDDHTQLGAVQIRKNDTIKEPRINGLRGTGARTEWEMVDKKFTVRGQDIRIRTVGTYHDTMQGLEYGKNAVFIVEVDGLRIVHLGDLGHILTKEQKEKIGPVDVLMIPVGGVYSLNGSEAKRVVAQLQPKQYIVPMHCGTAIFNDLLTVDEFLENQKPENVRRCDVDRKDKKEEEKKTNQLVIMSDFKPTEPVIVVLHYADK